MHTIYLAIRNHQVEITYMVAPYSPRCFDHDEEGGIEEITVRVDGRKMWRESWSEAVLERCREDVAELMEY